MKSSTLKIATPLFLLCLSSTTFAETFTLTSKDIAHGDFMGSAQEFKGFGCNGDNLSPQLAWQNAPKGTEAFALTVYDPDAPTGSGWWHWQVVNIPKSVSSLASGAGSAEKNAMPKGSV